MDWSTNVSSANTWWRVNANVDDGLWEKEVIKDIPTDGALAGSEAVDGCWVLV
jgi:hypothetical protein